MRKGDPVQFAREFQRFLITKGLQEFDTLKNGNKDNVLDADETKTALQAFLEEKQQPGCFNEASFDSIYQTVSGMDNNENLSANDMYHPNFVKNAKGWFTNCTSVPLPPPLSEDEVPNAVQKRMAAAFQQFLQVNFDPLDKINYDSHKNDFVSVQANGKFEAGVFNRAWKEFCAVTGFAWENSKGEIDRSTKQTIAKFSGDPAQFELSDINDSRFVTTFAPAISKNGRSIFDVEPKNVNAEINKLRPFLQAPAYSQTSWKSLQTLLPSSLKNITSEEIKPILEFAKNLPVQINDDAQPMIEAVLEPLGVTNPLKQQELIKTVFAAKFFASLPTDQTQRSQMLSQVVNKIELGDYQNEAVSGHVTTFMSTPVTTMKDGQQITDIKDIYYQIDSNWLQENLMPQKKHSYHEFGHHVFQGRNINVMDETFEPLWQKLTSEAEVLKKTNPNNYYQILSNKYKMDVQYVLTLYTPPEQQIDHNRAVEELKAELFQSYMLHPKAFETNFKPLAPEIYKAFSKQFSPAETAD